MPRITVKPQTVIFILLLWLADRSAWTLIPLAAATVHELGHIIVMRILGCRVDEIEITVFGAEIRSPLERCHWGCAAAIYAAGGAANLMCTAAVLFMPSASDGLRFFGACSAALATVNLLPIRFLDGGAIVMTVCERLIPTYADAVSSAVSAVTLFVLWLVSVYMLLLCGGNLSLFLFCAYLFVTLYLKK